MTIQAWGKKPRGKSLKVFVGAFQEGALITFPITDGIQFWEESAGECGPLARLAGSVGLLLSEGLILGLVITILALVGIL